MNHQTRRGWAQHFFCQEEQHNDHSIQSILRETVTRCGLLGAVYGNITCGESTDGSTQSECGRTPGDESLAGLRPALAESLSYSSERRSGQASRGYHHLEGALPEVLAEVGPFLPTVDWHCSWGGGPHQHAASWRYPAWSPDLHRCAGALCRREVLHVHDPGRAHVCRLDHLERLRRGGRHGGPQRGP